ncbi:MAG TPA: hypothetical protein VM841_10225 [Actinomycetota bacterium]|nr:hypothetical protein [Actinomycetota bacterium]
MRIRGRLGIVGLLLAATIAAGPAPARAASPATLLDAIRSEADYILSLRTGDGVITTAPNRVVPYLANFAAMGLARAHLVLRDGRYATAAWRWLEWYRDHMHPDGTMPDWVYSSSWVPTGDPDSTDAYAGTYLSAVLATFEATGDLLRLRALHGGVLKAVAAIELTADVDGLHFAKPGWPFKYSMDEAEAYAGFRAAQRIGRALNDASLEARAKTNADRLLSASIKLIDPATGLYLWALHQDGTRVVAPIEWIYPGASAQAWAVADGLATGSNARNLMARVEAAQPFWDRPTATAQYANAQPNCNFATPCYAPVNYWPRFALAYLAIGNARRAMQGALSIHAAAKSLGRGFPYTPGDAGQIILTLADPQALAESLIP